MKKPEQLSIFTQILDSAFLVAAASPRQAFYRIWIEKTMDSIKIVKESGVKGRVLDKRTWLVDDLEAAQKLFTRRIKSKTNQERKSPRKYEIVNAV